MEIAVRRLDGEVKPLGGGVAATFLGRSVGGARSVYKPGYLETLLGVLPDLPLRFGIPRGGGHLAYREQGAYRVDEALGFGRVPPTSITNGPYGLGSNQIWAYSTPSHPKAAQLRLPREDWLKRNARDELRRLNDRYPKIQREQMAVLDYVIGNTDRHWGNYRTGRNGDIVAIDHGLSCPESPDSRIGIRSDFVEEFHNAALSEEVMTQVDAVDLGRLRAALLDSQLSEVAVNGALDRLIEIRTHGRITGQAWPGEINANIVFMKMTKPSPTGWIET
ncbi:hypothetical protein [Nocardia sp. NPDC002869]|uniref:hypothetical protein n=1 Tax=Nocardia sp. NPDC002869 TaxID=3161032 RepID=UPI00398C9EE1